MNAASSPADEAGYGPQNLNGEAVCKIHPAIVTAFGDTHTLGSLARGFLMDKQPPCVCCQRDQGDAEDSGAFALSAALLTPAVAGRTREVIVVCDGDHGQLAALFLLCQRCEKRHDLSRHIDRALASHRRRDEQFIFIGLAEPIRKPEGVLLV